MATIVAFEARNGRPQTASNPTSTSYKKHRKAVRQIIESDPEDDPMQPSSRPMDPFPILSSGGITYTMDTDISLLEAPTFTTLDRGPSKTMLNLKWDHSVNLTGKKVVNPMIHCCDHCLKPILIYGRMIPCKHVFCLNCASSQATTCSRCSDKVTRVEPVGLGSIYMCSHGGSRYGNSGCRRTYLSQRDLQAHIQHRHIKSSVVTSVPVVLPVPVIERTPVIERKDLRTAALPQPSASYHDSLSSSQITNYRTQVVPRDSVNYGQVPSHISVIGSGPTTSSNLIAVPIQDTSNGIRDQVPLQPPQVMVQSYPYAPPSTANFSHPPPNVPSGHYYPPTPQPGSYTDNGQPQYASNWRTNSSSYYRR